MKKAIKNSKPRVDTYLKIAFIGIFYLILILPLLQQKTHFLSLPIMQENRLRADRPEGNFVLNVFLKSNTFPKAYEKYFNDHYGFRDLLIRFKNSIDHRLFHHSDEVVLGADGWMEYRSVIDVEEVANERLTREQLLFAAGKIEKMSEVLSAQGITLIVVPIPNKNSIYPEFFANTEVRRPRPTAFQHFTNLLTSNAKLVTIDAEAILLQEKNNHPVFYQTDFHWNEVGAYVVSKALVSRLGELSGAGTQWLLPQTVETVAFQGGLNISLATLRLPTETGYFIAKKESLPPQPLLPETYLVGNSFSIAMRNINMHQAFSELHFFDTVSQKSLSTNLVEHPKTRFVIFEFIETNLSEQFQNPEWWDSFFGI